MTKWSSPLVDMMLHGDQARGPRAGEGGCAHGRNMSSRPSAWPCPQPSTTASTRWRLMRNTPAYGHRRRTGLRLRTTLHGDRRELQPGGRSSPSCTRSCRHLCLRWLARWTKTSTAEQTIENFVPVQMLDVHVPSVVKILMNDGTRDRSVQDLSPRPTLRAVLSATQMAEQLVEVPWVSPSSCVLNDLVPQIGNELVDVPNVVSQQPSVCRADR